MSQDTELILVCVKTGLNAFLPGSGAAVDFLSAISKVTEEDYTGAFTDVGSGLMDLVTCGAYGAVKTACKSFVEITTKETAKQAIKELGRITSKEIAKRATKEAVVNTAKHTAKTAMKKIGQRAGEEIAKMALERGVEKTAYDVTKSSYGSKEFAKSAPKDVIMPAAANKAEITIAKHAILYNFHCSTVYASLPGHVVLPIVPIVGFHSSI